MKSPCNVEITDGQQTYMSIAFGCSQQQKQLPQLLTLDTAHNKAGIHLRLTMFCLPQPQLFISTYTVHSALSAERETATQLLLISSRSSFNLEGACV